MLYLQTLLQDNRIPFDPPDTIQFPLLLIGNDSAITSTPIGAFPPCSGNELKSPITPTPTMSEGSPNAHKIVSVRRKSTEEGGESDTSNETGLNKLVSDIGLVSVQGASDPRYLGSVSGISFARVVFAAVKSITTTTTGAGSKRGSVSGNASNSTDSNTHPEVGDTAMRDSFFGLATNRKKVRPAKWPSRQLANKLVGLYFDHANPQLPILHKGEFEAMVERVYTLLPERKWQGPRYQKTHTSQGEDDNGRRKTVGERELYMMYIVFGIGAGIFLETDSASSTSGASDDDRDARRNGGRFRKTDRSDPRNSATNSNDPLSPPSSKRLKRDRFDVKQEPPAEEEDYEMIDVEKEDDFEVEERQYSPEEYHAAALPHLEAFLSSESKGGTEELQAVLLLAGYALLRPVAPGLWYIVGVAMRMAVDLGLHFEDNTLEGMNIDGKEDDDKTKGRKEWHREMRRRLWWSVYSLDRLVSTCVGRPIGIQDEVISTRVCITS